MNASAGIVRVSRLFLAALLATTAGASAAVVWTAPAASAGGVYVVTTTADTGAGSLRAAITAVNADATATAASPATITFNIPAAGVQTISVATALPQITKPVLIDGTSQPGATCGDAVTPRKLLISIRGQGNTVAMSGLFLTGGHSTVQGLAISFFRSGDLISTGAAGGDVIRCNHLGTRADGVTMDTMGSNGVTMTGNPTVTASLDVSSPNTVVGGTNHTVNKCDGDCNVVVGESGNNTQQAIILRFGPHTTTAFNGFTSTSSAAGGRMSGNFFGILANGDTPPSALKSARILSITSADAGAAAAPAQPFPIPSSGGYLIGGLNPDGSRDDLAANVISAAKFRDGIDSDTGTGGASGIKVYGNYIGTGPGGTTSVDSAGRMYGNARDGIQLEGQESIDIQANVIAGNGSNGINAGSISSNSLIKNNLIGQLVNGTASGNGWYSTAITSGPNVGIGGVSTNANAGSGNGISIGAYGATTPNRDVANLTIDGNTIVNSYRAGIIAVGGSGNTTIKNNIIGQSGQGNGAAGIVMMTADNTIQNNTISYNGGAGVTILRNTNPLMGTVFGAFTPLPTYASQNLIATNSVFANTGLGIDLATINSPWAAGGNTLAYPYAWTVGVTGNNGALSVAPPTVAGGFGNRDQDYPVITAATLNAASNTLTVFGHVGLAGGSAAFNGSTVEVFQGHNLPADQNGETYLTDATSVAHPEGITFLGACPVDSAGQFSGCALAVTSADIIANPMLTSTATLSHSTSEFGPIFTSTLVGSIAGTVFVDGSNAPLAGVTVTVTDGAGNTQTSVTDASGVYAFADLPMGDYTISETQPAGYGSGAVTPSNTIAVTLDVVSPDSIGNDFSETVGTIAGSVFVDGTLNPIAGVQVTLTGTDANGAPVTATTVTLADGTYQFAGLLAGDYTITETQPGGYAPGEVTPANTIPIALAAGGNSAGNDFSETVGTIAGSVFVDGTLNPIAGVQVTLTGTDANGAPVTATTVTLADGTYQFAGLLAGDYTITETQPAGYGQGQTRPTDVDSVGLAAGQNVTDIDFSETVASVSGRVYLDGSGNGISGVTIHLTGVDVFGNSVNLSTVTAADGTYMFEGLAGGDFTLTETQPSYADGTVEPDNTIAIEVPSGWAYSGNDFSESAATISGSVSLDGTGAALPGVTITLDGITSDGQQFSASTTTAADGSYMFNEVPLGQYTVTETQPVGRGEGSVEPDDIITVVIAAGGDHPNNNFTETTGIVSITGSVWLDHTMTPLAGVTITLTGVDDFGNPVSATLTTGVDGTYMFAGLVSGQYTVSETQPILYGDGEHQPTNTYAVPAAAGATITNIDFSESAATISGRVFVDGTDIPLAGVVVQLTGTDGLGNPVTLSTATDTNGNYQFTDLAAGTYTVTETQPASFGDGTVNPANVIQHVDVAAGATVAGNNFSEAPGSISGRVFVAATNGPIGGVTVQLLNSNGTVIATATTAADGSYHFGGLPAGVYSVRELQPAGWDDGQTLAGTAGGTPQTNIVVNIDLGAGVNAVSYDFGEVLVEGPRTGTATTAVIAAAAMLAAAGVLLVLVGRRRRPRRA